MHDFGTGNQIFCIVKIKRSHEMESLANNELILERNKYNEDFLKEILLVS